jgi:hypothetical protein
MIHMNKELKVIENCMNNNRLVIKESNLITLIKET